MTIGTPPQSFLLQADTGSTTVWVPSASSETCQSKIGCPLGEFSANESSTFILGKSDFNGSYGDGNGVSGNFFTDVLQIGNITITNMTIGLANRTTQGSGILGLGYAINENIEPFDVLDAQDLQNVSPPIYDQLMSQGVIDRAAYSLYLDDLEANAGSILFGAVDSTKYTGNLVSLPVQPSLCVALQNDTSDCIYSTLSVALTSIAINDQSGTRMLTSSNFSVPALLDSGNSQQTWPEALYSQLVKGLGGVPTGADNYGQPYVPCSYKNANASITYTFGHGPNITVPFSELLVGKPNGTFPNGEARCLFRVGSDKYVDGGGVGLGDTFLRSAYVVYDLQNNEIALAQANWNATSTSNIMMIPSGTGLPGVSSTATLMAPVTTVSEAALTATSAASVIAGSGTAAASSISSTAASSSSNGNPATPTFSLGSAASATAAASSSGSASSAGVQTVIFGNFTWVFSFVLGFGALLGAAVL